MDRRELEVQDFERQIRRKGLKPLQVIFERGSRVKWFVCDDTRAEREYDLIVYDSRGKALVLTDYDKTTDIVNILEHYIKGPDIMNIKSYSGGVTINGEVPMRDSSLDLEFQKTES